MLVCTTAPRKRRGRRPGMHTRFLRVRKASRCSKRLRASRNDWGESLARVTGIKTCCALSEFRVTDSITLHHSRARFIFLHPLALQMSNGVLKLWTERSMVISTIPLTISPYLITATHLLKLFIVRLLPCAISRRGGRGSGRQSIGRELSGEEGRETQ